MVRYCYCGYEIVLRHSRVDGETHVSFLSAEGVELEVCPQCGMHWSSANDVQYSRPARHSLADGDTNEGDKP